jgi:hypothetical protein
VWILYLVLFPGLCWLVPGYTASAWLYPRTTPLERLGTTLLLGILLVVPLAYCLPFFLRFPVTPLWILGTAGLVTLVCWSLRRRFPLPESEPLGEATSQGTWAVFGILLLVTYTTFTTVPDHSDAVGLFQVCPHQSAQYLLDDGEGPGLVAWDASDARWVAHRTYHDKEPGYGLFDVLVNQRPGSMATLVQPIAFHGSGGLVVATFCYDLLVVVFAALLAARRLRSWWAVLMVSAVFLFGCRSVSMYQVNENMLGLGLSLGALHLILGRRGVGTAILGGLCMALCIGVRPVLAASVPAALALLCGGDWSMTRRRWAAFTLALAVAILPWLLTQAQVFDSAFYHPSLDHSLHERSLPPQSILGWEFEFHPLNFPVADTIVRPPFEPFPNLFQMPLTHFQAFGVLFWIVAFAGMVAVGWKRLLLLGAWVAPNYLVLLLLVSVDHQKLSYALLSFTALPYLVGLGGRALFDNVFSRADKWLVVIVSLGFLVGFPQLIAGVELPVDDRQHHNNRRFFDHRDNAVKQAEAVETHWLPGYTETDPNQVWSLLRHSRPPQLIREDAQSPVFVWRMRFPATHHFQTRLSAQPELPAELGDVATYRFTWRYLAIVLQLQSAAEQVDVTFSAERGAVRIAVDTGGVGRGEGAPRYVSLGFLDLELADLEQWTVLVDGEPLSLERYLFERPGWGKPLLRLLSNERWHFEMHGVHSRLRRGASGNDCLAIDYESNRFHLRRQAPDAPYQVDAGAPCEGESRP